MNRLKIAGLLVLGLQFTQSALADPVISLGKPLGGKTFAMFYMNNKKIDSSPAQELIALTNLLNSKIKVYHLVWLIPISMQLE
jgi:hypothetical protein